MKFYYVYILLSKKDYKFYIGCTNDFKRRYFEHQRGENTSTATRLPLQLIFYEAYLSKKDALRREHYFKTTKGKAILKNMLKESLMLISN